MQKLHNGMHPVELLLIGGLALMWAIWSAARLLVVPLLALAVVLLTPRRPAPEPAAVEPEPVLAAPIAPEPEAAAPVAAAGASAHPLAELGAIAADAMQHLTATELRRRARAAGLPRSLSRSGRRDALLQALAGLEVAAV